ncbi:hypothetical protein [Hymenobacter lucidus]|uniref:Lipoprotein n=1 Tax=Hymenobacter lucidus TaxID=2880930 RepID=A0ABS8AUG6_9BACT|nr:hypothetical protein [Hymenobacter lucidus]MCB2409867.1 hypothetical protein [Hymenobacter lucidus]
MKLLKSIGQTALLLTVLACSREKVPTQEVEGYSFSINPKGSSAQETVGMILGQVNEQQAQKAAADGKDQYTGLGQVQEDGTVEVPQPPTDTDYLVVSDSTAFQKMLERQTFGAFQPNAKPIDFRHYFVVLLIHPPAAFSGATFLDGVEAEVEADNTVRLELSSTALPAPTTPGLTSGQYDHQVSIYRIAKRDFKRAQIVFDNQQDAPPVYVAL